MFSLLSQTCSQQCIRHLQQFLAAKLSFCVTEAIWTVPSCFTWWECALNIHISDNNEKRRTIKHRKIPTTHSSLCPPFPNLKTLNFGEMLNKGPLQPIPSIAIREDAGCAQLCVPTFMHASMPCSDPSDLVFTFCGAFSHLQGDWEPSGTGYATGLSDTNNRSLSV